MRGRSGLLAVMAAGTFSLATIASEKAPESYVKNMKDTNAAAQSLRKNVEAADYDAIAKDAAALKTLFETTESFWSKRNADDAVTIAKNGSKAAGELEAAAQAKNAEAVATAAKGVTSTCKACHDAHRERLPDNTYEIK